MSDVDLVELAPGVRRANDFDDVARLVQLLEAGIGVRRNTPALNVPETTR